MRIEFERDREIERRPTFLPSDLYKKLRHLRTLQGKDALFIPIRSLQYLAVVDEEEVFFVDGLGDRRIVLAWQNFRPADCARIGDPVPFELVIYRESARDAVLRLVREFSEAIELYESRHVGMPASGASITPFKQGE